MNQNNSEELTHYGVIGMKWGHRRAQYYDKKAQAAKAKAKKYKGLVGEYEYKKKADKAVAKANLYKQKAKDYEEKYVTDRALKTIKTVADNKYRVNRYGKTAVQVADAAHIATTAYGSHVARKFVARVGTGVMRRIAADPSLGKGVYYATAAVTAGALGAITVGQIKRTTALADDIGLASMNAASLKSDKKTR